MIRGFTNVGQYEEALSLFHDMEILVFRPNTLTLLSTLSACASRGALEDGA